MNKLSIGAAALAVMVTGLVTGAWGQRTIERHAAPAPNLQQTPAKPRLQAQPATPALAKHELAHVVQQAHPPAGLTPEETRALNRVSERLRHKNRAVAQAEWEQVVRSAAQRNAKVDINAMVAYVLRQSYIETNQELKQRADRVRHFNEQKQAAREHAKALRRQKAELERSDDPTRTVTVRRLTLSDNYDDDDRAVLEAPPTDMTVDSVADELQRVVVLANTAEQNEELANIDLQDALQKQQQTLQTMSNVSKMLHDTAKAAINNIR